jgi:hypothetical protein
MRPADTSPEAWRVYLDIIRQMTPAQKMRRTLEWSAEIRLFAEAGLRERFPQADEREIFLRSARMRLGADLFRKVYGDVLPHDEPLRDDH